MNIRARIKNICGFTLIESLVAVGLFSVISSIAVGGFALALNTQRNISGLVAANNNVSLALEQMAREIRTGFSFCVGETVSLCGLSAGTIAFINDRRETVVYGLSSGAIEKKVGSGAFEKITGNNVEVKYLVFNLRGQAPDDGLVPLITISIGVGSREANISGIVTRLQTTVSSRVLDS